MENISGVILTKNNQRTIFECLQSIKGLVQELIIIDDYSDDNTITIIKEVFPEDQIIKRLLNRFDEQRNFGISKATNNWILMIDSDEIISPELANSIKNLTEEKDIDAYWVIRMNQFFKTYLPEKYIDRPLLFRSGLKFINPVHEIIKVDKDKFKKISGTLIHNNWLGIEFAMEKMNRYSGLIANKWIEQKRNYSNATLFFLAIILPIRYFFICLFKKKFYKAGLFNGVFYSLFESSWWLAVIFKYREQIKR